MHHEREITPMLILAIFSAVLGMFQFGFNTGVINAPQKVLEEFIANIYHNRTGEWITEELRDVIWSVTVSVFAIGGMIGGIVAPMVANWCGRKTGLVLNNTVAVLGVTLMSSSQLSQSIECLVIGRFFIGFNCGLNTALVPMYLTEIATVNLRGALGTVSQLGVTVGLLFSQVLGLKEILGTKEHWPFLFGIAFIPAILQLILLPFCPESPRYLLLTCGRFSEARQALKRLRNCSDVEDDMEEMKAEDRAHQEEVAKYGKLTSVRELLNHPWLRTPLIIGVMMQLSQQLSGINAIFYYSTDIFLSAEVPENFAVYATIGVGAIMVIMTLVSIPLMDRLGRRTLHLYGLAGMFLASIFLTISLLVKFLYDWMKFISVFSILFYTLFFGIGPGSIPLMITAELFTQGSRPAAMSVSVFVNWFSNFAVGLTFPLMKRVLQSYLFLPFTVFLAIFWIFTYKLLPETKNRTFEEIAALFRPIQLGATGAFPDYGCTLASLGVPVDAVQGLTPGSLDTPASAGGGPNNNHQPGGGSVEASNFNGGTQNKSDRFRFDSVATGNYITEQQLHNRPTCSNGYCGDGDADQQQQHQHHHHHNNNNSNQPKHRTSQGNLNNYHTHTSCTSIAQNLSTSDQQPLIVDHVQHDRCQFHYLHHPQKITSTLNNNNTCCLETTSFMAAAATGNLQALNSCTCCERDLMKGARSSFEVSSSLNGYRDLLRMRRRSKSRSRSRSRINSGDNHDVDDDDDDDDEDVDDDIRVTNTNTNNIDDGDDGDDEDPHPPSGIIYSHEQRKSRTLTRVYKPLNDLHFPPHYTSTKNLLLLDNNININNNNDTNNFNNYHAPPPPPPPPPPLAPTLSSEQL